MQQDEGHVRDNNFVNYMHLSCSMKYIHGMSATLWGHDCPYAFVLGIFSAGE